MGNGGSGISVPQFSYPNIAPSPAVPANLAAANNQYAGGGGGGSPARSWDNGSRTGGTASAGGGYGRCQQILLEDLQDLDHQMVLI